MFANIRGYNRMRHSNTFCDGEVPVCTKRLVADSYPRECFKRVSARVNLLTQIIPIFSTSKFRYRSCFAA